MGKNYRNCCTRRWQIGKKDSPLKDVPMMFERCLDVHNATAATRPIVAGWFEAEFSGRQRGNVKTFDQALSDAKYKKVHWSHLRGKKRGHCVSFEKREGR